VVAALGPERIAVVISRSEDAAEGHGLRVMSAKGKKHSQEVKYWKALGLFPKQYSAKKGSVGILFGKWTDIQVGKHFEWGTFVRMLSLKCTFLSMFSLFHFKKAS
jgi:hypothetical protein